MLNCIYITCSRTTQTAVEKGGINKAISENLNLFCRYNFSFQTSSLIYNTFIFHNDPDIGADKAPMCTTHLWVPFSCGLQERAENRYLLCVISASIQFFWNKAVCWKPTGRSGNNVTDNYTGFPYYQFAGAPLITDLLGWAETVLFLWRDKWIIFFFNLVVW